MFYEFKELLRRPHRNCDDQPTVFSSRPLSELIGNIGGVDGLTEV